MMPRLHAIEIEEAEDLVVWAIFWSSLRCRVALVESVEHYFVAVLIGIGPVQNEGWIGFEPLDVTSHSRHYGESGW